MKIDHEEAYNKLISIDPEFVDKAFKNKWPLKHILEQLMIVIFMNKLKEDSSIRYARDLYQEITKGNIYNDQIKDHVIKNVDSSIHETEESHNSFGMISISKPMCNKGLTFFGSSIKHNTYIKLVINRAVKYRSLNRDSFFPKNPLIEISMSPNQFTEMITSMHGSGVPVTINHFNFIPSEPCPEENKREEIDKEFEQSCKKKAKQLHDVSEKYRERLKNKKPFTKKEKESLLSDIEFIQSFFSSTLPFMKKQWSEQMDKTVVEAKTEIDGFMQSIINKVGLKYLPKEMQDRFITPEIEE